MDQPSQYYNTPKNEKAKKAWLKALEIIGGSRIATELSGIRQCKISLITNGSTSRRKDATAKDGRHQHYPTVEQAIKISILTKGKIRAEKLIPHHNFKYIYKYVKLMDKP